MLVIMLFAFRGAGVADSSAKLEHLFQRRLIRPRPANRQLAGRLANVGTIKAGADALRHRHLFGEACVRATQAHARAVHEVMGSIAERLIDVAGDIGVQGNHLADGH